jgi:hypothetical protein
MKEGEPMPKLKGSKRRRSRAIVNAGIQVMGYTG